MSSVEDNSDSDGYGENRSGKNESGGDNCKSTGVNVLQGKQNMLPTRHCYYILQLNKHPEAC